MEHKQAITNMLIQTIVGIMNIRSKMGESDHLEMMNYLDKYPNLNTIPLYELEYMAYKLSPNPESIYAHHDDILNSLVDLSTQIQLDDDLNEQINQYRKQPWTASFKHLSDISEKIVQHQLKK